MTEGAAVERPTRVEAARTRLRIETMIEIVQVQEDVCCESVS